MLFSFGLCVFFCSVVVYFKTIPVYIFNKYFIWNIFKIILLLSEQNNNAYFYKLIIINIHYKYVWNKSEEIRHCPYVSKRNAASEMQIIAIHQHCKVYSGQTLFHLLFSFSIKDHFTAALYSFHFVSFFSFLNCPTKGKNWNCGSIYKYGN